jgi:CelD/BcsL family acetyltransferase involved in cellulose biosynthesis
MVDSTALPEGMSRVATGAGRSATAAGSRAGAELSVSVTRRIEDVHAIWTAFAVAGVDSPGQSYDFTRLWAEKLSIPEGDRVFVSVALAGEPVAFLPLRQRRMLGVTMLTWFPGPHVGCNAPLLDVARLQVMPAEERRTMWRQMAAELGGADLLYLPAMPELPHLAELGVSIPGDTLYRAEFSGWETANTTQRSKSRRKHDRQQGERLDALGQVTFEELGASQDRAEVLATMFRQRAARFAATGVCDPFADPAVRSFYDATLDPASGTDVKLHVLRLDGEIVAVRYNIVEGSRMFCLISSMSDDPRIQGGSPGKQCLLRVMQTVFDAGYTNFDMGAGFTDEKRHWCNVQVPLRQHYLPRTVPGYAAAFAHRLAQSARREIKSNKTLLALAKRLRAIKNRGANAPAEEPAE